MTQQSVMERLQKANPKAEIWWDSSPLVYKKWAERMIANAPAGKKALWEEQLKLLFDPQAPEKTLFRGVTTNPPLCLNALKDDPEFWADYVQDLIQKNPDSCTKKIYWMTYKKIVELGAKTYLPVWEASNHAYGYLSGQVDPRDSFDYKQMLKQALDLADIAPNVMVKVPGTREGYLVIEELTARGIATNNTLSFTVPQFVACMNAVSQGLKRARANGVDLFRWRSVITHMAARYGMLGDLKTQAETRGIELDEADIRWAELAIFKRACQILQEKDHPSKMLMCSMRISPPLNGGAKASWHIEKITGADVVYTCPPGYIQELMEVEDQMQPFSSEAIYEEPPKATLEKLLRIPYFVQAYEPDGMARDDFNKQGALIATAAEFQRATRMTQDFVSRQFEKMGKGVACDNT